MEGSLQICVYSTSERCVVHRRSRDSACIALEPLVAWWGFARRRPPGLAVCCRTCGRWYRCRGAVHPCRRRREQQPIDRAVAKCAINVPIPLSLRSTGRNLGLAYARRLKISWPQKKHWREAKEGRKGPVQKRVRPSTSTGPASGPRSHSRPPLQSWHACLSVLPLGRDVPDPPIHRPVRRCVQSLLSTCGAGSASTTTG